MILLGRALEDDPTARPILPGYPRGARIPRADRKRVTRGQRERRQHDDAGPRAAGVEAELGMDGRRHQRTAVDAERERRERKRRERVAQGLERM